MKSYPKQTVDLASATEILLEVLYSSWSTTQHLSINSRFKSKFFWSYFCTWFKIFNRISLKWNKFRIVLRIVLCASIALPMLWRSLFNVHYLFAIWRFKIWNSKVNIYAWPFEDGPKILNLSFEFFLILVQLRRHISGELSCDLLSKIVFNEKPSLKSAETKA